MSFPVTTSFARRVAAVSLRGAVMKKSVFLPARPNTIKTPCVFIRQFSMREPVPPEEYQDGHLITDHLEYLDDMIGKTLKIEDQMAQLRQTYAEKRQAVEESASPETIQALYWKSDAQKNAISKDVADLHRSFLIRRKIFAVDAPDGTSDELNDLYVEEAQSIINDSQPKVA